MMGNSRIADMPASARFSMAHMPMIDKCVFSIIIHYQVFIDQ